MRSEKAADGALGGVAWGGHREEDSSGCDWVTAMYAGDEAGELVAETKNNETRTGRQLAPRSCRVRSKSPQVPTA